MKITCLVKTFSGKEFCTSSLESIYNFCDNIVFVHSEVSWSGKKGNDVYPIIYEWTEKNDTKGKITNIRGNWYDQDSQYDFGLKYIQQNFEQDYIMLIDTDEIWDFENLNKSKNILENNKDYNSFTCNMFTYVKSPYYRVEKIEPCKPVVFLRSNIKEMLGIRGNGIQPKYYMKDVIMHHFCYVRENENIIKDKFITSKIGDKNESNSDWFENKWNKINFKNLNNIENLHPTVGAEYCWNKLIKVGKNDLPMTVQKNKILELWNEETGEYKW